MNLRLWVQALLLLWLSLTAVCGGECLSSLLARASSGALPNYSLRDPLFPPHARSSCLPGNPARALQEQPRASHTGRPIDRASGAGGDVLCSYCFPEQFGVWYYHVHHHLALLECPSQFKALRATDLHPMSCTLHPAPHVVAGKRMGACQLTSWTGEWIRRLT